MVFGVPISNNAGNGWREIEIIRRESLMRKAPRAKDTARKAGTDI
jgi:hypothetical protein